MQSIALCFGTGIDQAVEEAAFVPDHFEVPPNRLRKKVEPEGSGEIAIADALAAHFSFQGETHTFTHSAVPFESALWQGLCLLREKRVSAAVVCGADGLNALNVAAGYKLGWWRESGSPIAPMTEPHGTGQGTLPGEGAAAFLLVQPETLKASLGGPRIPRVQVGPLSKGSLQDINGSEEFEFIRKATSKAGYQLEEIQFAVFGANGDPTVDEAYRRVADALTAAAKTKMGYGVYKQGCGEHRTAPAIGFALAVQAVQDGHLPPDIQCIRPPAGEAPLSKALVYHLHEAGYQTVCLVTG
jgi:3-oxoacyl-(acyl-carrier-protein) synthase